jgi:hypothetical protein
MQSFPRTFADLLTDGGVEGSDFFLVSNRTEYSVYRLNERPDGFSFSEFTANYALDGAVEDSSLAAVDRYMDQKYGGPFIRYDVRRSTIFTARLPGLNQDVDTYYVKATVCSLRPPIFFDEVRPPVFLEDGRVYAYETTERPSRVLIGSSAKELIVDVGSCNENTSVPNRTISAPMKFSRDDYGEVLVKWVFVIHSLTTISLLVADVSSSLFQRGDKWQSPSSGRRRLQLAFAIRVSDRVPDSVENTTPSAVARRRQQFASVHPAVARRLTISVLFV